MLETLSLAGSLVALLACVLVARRCRKIEQSAWQTVAILNDALQRYAKGDA